MAQSPQNPYEGLPTLDDALSLGANAYNQAASKYQELARMGASRDFIQRQASKIGFAPVALDANGNRVDLTDFYARRAEMSVGEQVQDFAAGFGRGLASLPGDVASLASIPIEAATGYKGVSDFAGRYRQGVNELIPTSNKYRSSTSEAVGGGVSSVATMLLGGAGAAKLGIGMASKAVTATEAARKAQFAMASAKNAMRIATISGAGGEAGAAQAQGAGVGAQLLAAGGGAAAAQLERFGAERVIKDILSPAMKGARYTGRRAARDVAGGFVGEVGEELVAAPITAAGRSGYQQEPFLERAAEEMKQAAIVAPLAILPFSAVHGFKASAMVRRDNMLAKSLPDIYAKRTGTLEQLSTVAEGQLLERNVVGIEDLRAKNPDAAEELEFLSARVGGRVNASSAATQRVAALGQMLSESGVRVVYFEPGAKPAKEGEPAKEGAPDADVEVAGFYDPRTATVYVNSSLPENVQIMQGLVHEMMHDLHKDSPGGLTQIHDRLQKAFGETYTNYMRSVAERYSEYAPGSAELTEEQVNNFLTQGMAGYLGLALTNQDVFKYAAYNDPGLLSTVAETFSRFMGLSIDKYNQRDQQILSQRLENIASEIGAQFGADPAVGRIDPSTALRVANEVVLGMQNALEVRASFMPTIRNALAKGPEAGKGIFREQGGRVVHLRKAARKLAVGSLTESQYRALYPEGTYPTAGNDVVVSRDNPEGVAVGTVLIKAGDPITPEAARRVSSVPVEYRDPLQYSLNDILEKMVLRAIRVDRLPKKFLGEYRALSSALESMAARPPRYEYEPAMSEEEARLAAKAQAAAGAEFVAEDLRVRTADYERRQRERAEGAELEEMYRQEREDQARADRAKSEAEYEAEFAALAELEEAQRRNRLDDLGAKASMYLLARVHITRIKAEHRALATERSRQGLGSEQASERERTLELAIGEFYKLEREVKELFGRGFDIDTEAPPSVSQSRYRRGDYRLERPQKPRPGETELATELRGRERQEVGEATGEMRRLNDRRNAILSFIQRARGNAELSNTFGDDEKLSGLANRAIQARKKLKDLRRDGGRSELNKADIEAAQLRLDIALQELESEAVSIRRRYAKVSKEREISRKRAGLAPKKRPASGKQRPGDEGEAGPAPEDKGPDEPEGGPPGGRRTPPEEPTDGGEQPTTGQRDEDEGTAQNAEERAQSQQQGETITAEEGDGEAQDAETRASQQQENEPPSQGIKIPPTVNRLPKRRTKPVTNVLDAAEFGIFIENMSPDAFSVITEENITRPTEWKSPKDPVAVAFIGGRFVSVLTIGGKRVPYYNSTGTGGKADSGVVPGRWYPFFGFGSDGWVNKGLGSDMAEYYGSDKLAMGAELLDSLYPNMAFEGTASEQRIPIEKLRSGRDAVNSFANEVDPDSGQARGGTFSLEEARADPNAFGKSIRAFIALADPDWAISRNISPDGTVAAKKTSLRAEAETAQAQEAGAETEQAEGDSQDGKYRDERGNWQPGHPSRIIRGGVPDDMTAEDAVEKWVKAEVEIRALSRTMVEAQAKGKLSGRYQTRLENRRGELDKEQARASSIHWAFTGKYLDSPEMREQLEPSVLDRIGQRGAQAEQRAANRKEARAARPRSARPTAESERSRDDKRRQLEEAWKKNTLKRLAQSGLTAEEASEAANMLSSLANRMMIAIRKYNESLLKAKAGVEGGAEDVEFFGRMMGALAQEYSKVSRGTMRIENHPGVDSVGIAAEVAAAFGSAAGSWQQEIEPLKNWGKSPPSVDDFLSATGGALRKMGLLPEATRDSTGKTKKSKSRYYILSDKDGNVVYRVRVSDHSRPGVVGIPRTAGRVDDEFLIGGEYKIRSFEEYKARLDAISKKISDITSGAEKKKSDSSAAPTATQAQPAVAAVSPAQATPGGTQGNHARLVRAGAKVSPDAHYDASVLKITSGPAKPDTAPEYINRTETGRYSWIKLAEEDNAFSDGRSLFFGTDKDAAKLKEYIQGLREKSKEKHPDGTQTATAKTAANKLAKLYPGGEGSKPPIDRVIPKVGKLKDETRVVASSFIDNPRLSPDGFKAIKQTANHYTYMLLSDGGVTSVVNAKYYNNILSRYPNAKVYLDGKTSSAVVAFVNEGRVVGLVMPITVAQNETVALNASDITILPEAAGGQELQPSRMSRQQVVRARMEELRLAEPDYERNSGAGVVGFLERAYTAGLDRFEAIRAVERNIARAADRQAKAAAEGEEATPGIERANYNSDTMNVSEMLDLYTGRIGENNRQAMEQRDEMIAAAKEYDIPVSMKEGRERGEVSADESLYASHAEVANRTLLEDRITERFDNSDEGKSIKKKIRSLNARIRKEMRSDDVDEDLVSELENEIGELEGIRSDTINDEVEIAFAKPATLELEISELRGKVGLTEDEQAQINTRLVELGDELDRAEREVMLSGMSNEEARDINKRIAASPKAKGYQRIRDAMTKLQDFKLRLMLESELIDKRTMETWKRRFGKTYIPLKTTIRDPDGSSFSGGGGISIRGKESKARMGRTDYADDIIAHSLVDFSQANSRAMRNTVSRAFFRLITGNLNAQNWTYLGTDLIKARQSGDYSVRDRERLISVKALTRQKDGSSRSVEHYAVVHSEDLARAARQLDGIDLGNFTAAAVSATRVFTKMQTAWNPAFILPNFMRDVALAMGVRYSDNGIKASGRLMKNIVPAMRTILAVELGSTRIGKALGFDKLKEGPFSVEYEEMKNLGGFSSPVDYGTVEEQMRRFVKEARSSPESRVGRATQMPISKVKSLFEFLEAVNTVAERATRLAAYVEMDTTLRESDPMHPAGSRKVKRAAAAKNMTVNFDRRGTSGPILNSLYAFYNANAQGTANLVRRLGPNADPDTRRRSMVAVSAFALFGYALSALARALSDDDEQGESAYKSVGLDEMQKNAVFMLPGMGSSRITVPLPWGANMAWFTGVQIERLSAGDVTAPEMADQIVGGMLTSFSPITGPTASMALVPTLARPFAEIDANINYAGNAIMPPSDPYDKTPLPDSRRAYRTVSTPLRYVSEFMNDMTGGSERVPGFIDISPESLEHLTEFAAGGAGRFVLSTIGADLGKEDMKVRDVPALGPIAGRFYRESDLEQRTMSEFYANAAKVAAYREDIKDPRTRDQAMSTGLGAVSKYATAVESRIRKLREQERRAAAAQNEEMVNRLKQNRYDIMRTFNQRFNRIAAQTQGV